MYLKRYERFKKILGLIVWATMNILGLLSFYIHWPKMFAEVKIWAIIANMSLLILFIISIPMELNKIPPFLLSEKGIIVPNYFSAYLQSRLFPSKHFKIRIIPFERINKITIYEKFFDKDSQYYGVVLSCGAGGKFFNFVMGTLTDFNEFLKTIYPRVPKDVKWDIYQRDMMTKVYKENVRDSLKEMCGGDCSELFSDDT